MSLDQTGQRAADAAAESLNTDLGLEMSAGDLAALKTSLRPLLKEIILELVNEGVINTNVNVTSVTGVTAGAGTSGPGTGTGTGSIS